MMRYLFIGAPGVGKGTYASRVAEARGFLHISSGDLLRSEVAKGSALGTEIKAKIDKGLFVPDTLVSCMIAEHLKANEAAVKRGYILDGYPRNISQAQFVFDTKSVEIDHVINFRQPYGVILAKMSSRRSCAGCGFGYNYAKIDEGGIKMDPLVPKVEGTCDKCGSTKPFVTRADDVYETVKQRLDLYAEVTAPLEAFYDSKGLLTHFDVLGGAKQYLPKLLEVMKSIETRAHAGGK